MGKMHEDGVTLIEAVVTLAVISVVLAIGVPAVRDIVATNRMSSAVNDLVTRNGLLMKSLRAWAMRPMPNSTGSTAKSTVSCCSGSR